MAAILVVTGQAKWSEWGRWCCLHCRAVFRRAFERCPNDGTQLSLCAADPVLGTTVNGLYEVEACVGEGAMGRVYRAHHLRLQRRQVALKILLGDLAATVAMRMRFTREAQAASMLSHPNVVPVLDFGKTPEGLLYLAMEYVHGRSLAHIIAEEAPMDPGRVVALTRQMCLGLGHAHAHGLIHRDFKPDNVLVVDGPGGEVPRIADFGLAIFSNDVEGDPTRLTNAGMVVGTPIYTAPEQALDQGLDQRVDLFALGVSMYEMLAGRPPFDDGSAVEILHNNLAAPRPYIVQRAPGVVVPPRLERIVHQLISADRDQRYPSAHALVVALDQLKQPASPDPVLLPPPGPPGAAVDPRRRGRRRLGLAATGAGLGLLLMAVILLWTAPDHGAPATTVPTASSAAPEQVAPATTAPTTSPAAHEADAIPAAPEGGDRVAATEIGAVPAAPPAAPPPQQEAERSGDPAPTVHKPNHRSRSAEAEAESRPVAAPAPSEPVSGEAAVDGARADRAPEGQAPAEQILATPSPPHHPFLPPPSRTPPALATGPAPPAADANPSSPSARPEPETGPAREGESPVAVFVAARAVIDELKVDGPLSDTEVQRALERIQGRLAGCHSAAASQAGRAPAGRTGGGVHVTLLIDENGRGREIRASGGNLPGLSSCVAEAIAAVRTRVAPDVGEARVSLRVDFVPREQR